jgi:integrase
VKLTGVWFHDLRRSFVTNARRRGVPESVVMRMSGHRTRAVFDRYNIIEEDDLRDAVKRIEAGIAKDSGASGQDQDKVKGG